MCTADGIAELREATDKAMSAYRRRNLADTSSGRISPSELRTACLQAEVGWQRESLLQIILRWQKRGYEHEDIYNLFYQLTSEMPLYDPESPMMPG